ncbi:hypothetical protein B0H16DRAFT_1895589 [Mycena metata]|uniref:Dynamin N-terminal domain-containing protein n=1 Tax=Mycena metata TaxID=1033252 RepID=A0AAD7HP81_9AGAR|nr:hypothetical protein B0H16DRAFT_1895589 [Mycena metata]
MTEDDVEMNAPPRPSAQKQYLLPLLNAFEATLSSLTLPTELRDEWSRSTADMKGKAVQRPYKVAILGRTGMWGLLHLQFCKNGRLIGTQAGKSTLVNALLEQRVLSASASGACTAVTTEISYRDVPTIEAVVEFISREQWAKDLGRLIEDVTDTTVDKEEEVTDTAFSPAYQARQKIYGIYPHLRNVSEKSWKVEELLNDPVVQDYLGQTKIFAAQKDVNFQKELEQFLASALAGSDTRVFWPLVKIVKIMGRFDVLSTGITLVDLPGHGDVDNTRDTMANEYLKTADAICLVAGITRAKDDRDIHAYLQKHLSQTIIDGRIQEKSILIALTSADACCRFPDPIGGNEITLKPTKQAIVDDLNQDALALTQELNALREKREKKEKSRAKKNASAALEKIREQMTALSQKRTIKTKEINRLRAVCVSSSNHYRLPPASPPLDADTKLTQDKYAQLYRDLSRLTADTPVPPIPIFCVGSRDFMRLLQVDDLDDPIIFREAGETGIPQLRSYFESHGERRNLGEAIAVVSHFCEFLSRTSSTQFSVSPMGNQATALTVQNAINDLEQRCGTRLNEMVAAIENVYDDLLVIVDAAVSDAEGKSPSIFQSHEAKKWNQYRAMMRQEGQYETGNLNADLTKDILPLVQRDWNIAVNNLTPLRIKDYAEEIQEDLINTVKSVSNDPSVRKSLGIETFMTSLHVANMDATKTAQRQGSRTWEPLMKRLLKPQYTKVSAEKGNGMYKRMKMNREFIQNHRSQLYGQMNVDIRNLFKESVANILHDNRLAFKRLCTQMRQTILGVKISPEFDALGQAEKSIKEFADQHEDPAVTLLDELKTRLQQIPSS